MACASRPRFGLVGLAAGILRQTPRDRGDATPSNRTRVKLAFNARFETEPQGVIFAPGRLNLIGEHVDHQEGLVLPIALEIGIHAAWGPRPDRAVRVVALDLNAGDRFVMGAIVKSGRQWADLVRGAFAALEAKGLRLPGIDLAIGGDLPARKGLGSSGALLVVVVKCALAAMGRAAPAREIARLAQGVEAEWGGVKCGVMDPYVAAAGTPGKPMMIDCRDVTHRDLPWPEQLEAVPFDTGIARSLAETPYNQRRAELEAGVAKLKELVPGLRSLRDLSAQDLVPLESQIPMPGRRRCRHVVREIERVHRAGSALEAGDAVALGAILDEGHASLSKDFQASTPEIDDMVAAKRAEPGVLGVRLQGAGWGGCLVVLRRASLA